MIDPQQVFQRFVGLVTPALAAFSICASKDFEDLFRKIQRKFPLQFFSKIKLNHVAAVDFRVFGAWNSQKSIDRTDKARRRLYFPKRIFPIQPTNFVPSYHRFLMIIN